MTDVFQFLLPNDPAPGVPDCHTQFLGQRGGVGRGGGGGGLVEYQNTRNKPSNIPKIRSTKTRVKENHGGRS